MLLSKIKANWVPEDALQIRLHKMKKISLKQFSRSDLQLKTLLVVQMILIRCGECHTLRLRNCRHCELNWKMEQTIKNELEFLRNGSFVRPFDCFQFIHHFLDNSISIIRSFKLKL